MDALSFAITQRIAPVVSISYGICETLLSASELDQYNSLFEEASAQGQTVVASFRRWPDRQLARFIRRRRG